MAMRLVKYMFVFLQSMCAHRINAEAKLHTTTVLGHLNGVAVGLGSREVGRHTDYNYKTYAEYVYKRE